MKQDSKTQRDFSLRLTSKRGDKFIIKYGYDASAKHSGCYIEASINGSDFSSTKKVLSRISSLKIQELNNVIDSIGTDVTGAPYNYEEESRNVIDSADWHKIISFYRIDTEAEEEALEAFIEKYSDATETQRNSLTKRYNNSRRIAFLEKSKSLIKGLRHIYYNGVEVNGNTHLPKTEGHLKNNHVPFYYKRDIDYVRKARYKIFTTVLNRKYIPFDS